MSIVTTNPAKVTVQLLDSQYLTHEQIFKLAHFIDAYEIEKELQDTLVIDIFKITKNGRLEIILTPTGGLTYDELSHHLNSIMTESLKNVNLDGCRWEVISILFITKVPGQPSFVYYEDIQESFKTD